MLTAAETTDSDIDASSANLNADLNVNADASSVTLNADLNADIIRVIKDAAPVPPSDFKILQNDTIVSAFSLFCCSSSCYNC